MFINRMSPNTYWTSFTAAVRSLESAGIPAPEGHHELLDRWREFKAIRSPHRDRLVEAVIGGDGDVAQLQALALAETVNAPAINEAVEKAVQSEAYRKYAAVAEQNYSALAKRFDAAADRLVTAMALVDPESDPADLLAADNKVRQAYQDGHAASAELTALVGKLSVAAELAGAERPHQDAANSSEAHHVGIHMLQLGLCTSFDGNPRDLWAAWSEEGPRTGAQWAALVKIGAKLHAVPLGDYQPRRQAGPLLERVTHDGRTERYDPEIEDAPPSRDDDGVFKPVQPPGPVTVWENAVNWR